MFETINHFAWCCTPPCPCLTQLLSNLGGGEEEEGRAVLSLLLLL